jgi:hypothetical protein
LVAPPDLLGEVRQASQDLGLSMADIMRQSMKLGLPKLREQLSPDPLKKLEAVVESGVPPLLPATEPRI